MFGANHFFNDSQNRPKSEFYLDLYYVFHDGGWPTSPEEYLKYVEKYLVYIPTEIDDPLYRDAWRRNNIQNGHNHRFHSPVDGTVKACKAVQGNVSVLT